MSASLSLTSTKIADCAHTTYDGRRVRLRESRSGWKYTGLRGGLYAPRS